MSTETALSAVHVEPVVSAHTECTHCGNTIGFVFGTCTKCGFNYLVGAFTWVRVYTEDLPDDCDFLIARHARTSAR